MRRFTERLLCFLGDLLALLILLAAVLAIVLGWWLSVQP